MDKDCDLFKRIAVNMSDVVALHSLDGHYLWVSPSVQRVLGYTPEELIGTDPYKLFHPQDIDAIERTTHQPAVAGAGNIYIRYRIRRSDGNYIWFETLTQPVLDECGNVIELHTTSRDITKQKQTEEALATSEALYRAAMDSLDEGVVVHAANGAIIAHNPRAADILGLTDDELNGRTSRDPAWGAIYPDGTPFLAESHPVMVTLRTGEPRSNVLMGVNSPRWTSRRWISINSRPVGDQVTDSPLGIAAVTSFTDVTDSLEQKNQLQRWSAVYRFSNEAILLIDSKGAIEDVNGAFCSLMLSEKSAWTGRQVDDITRESRSDDLFTSTIWPALDKYGSWRGELWLRDAQGGLQVTWATMTKVQQNVTANIHYTLILNNFNERFDREAQLRYDAGHDSLTGLPNRLLLKDRFAVAKVQAARLQQGFACLYLDLNKFKPINDQYGHTTGDMVLQRISERISRVTRSSDTVARIGGDEFFIIVFGLKDEDEYLSFAERINDAATQEVNADGLSFRVGASIGIALYPRHGTTLKALMDASDAAMYHAKRNRQSIRFAKS